MEHIRDGLRDEQGGRAGSFSRGNIAPRGIIAVLDLNSHARVIHFCVKKTWVFVASALCVLWCAFTAAGALPILFEL